MGQKPIQTSTCILSSFVFRFLPDNFRMSISGWAGELDGWQSRSIWEEPKDKWPQNARWDPRWLSKESTCQAGDAGDVGSIPGLGRSPGGGNGHPHQYSCLENPRDRGAWWATVLGVTESQTRLSNFTASTWPLGALESAYSTSSTRLYQDSEEPPAQQLSHPQPSQINTLPRHCVFPKFIMFKMYAFGWGSMWTLKCSMWHPVPWPGIEPRPLHWEL